MIVDAENDAGHISHRPRNSWVRLRFTSFNGFIDFADKNYSGTSTAKGKCVVQNLLHLDSLRNLISGENHIAVVAPQGKTSVDDRLPIL